MAETATADAGEGSGYTSAYVESLKRELSEKSDETAKLRAFKQSHDEKQREIISKMQPDVVAFVADVMNDAPDHASEMKSIGEWASNCATSNALDAALPLTRFISCASAQFKRTREEASAGKDKGDLLAKAYSELETVTTDRDGKVQRITELEGLCQERQSALDTLQAELAKDNKLSARFDFSKLSAREANASSSNEEASSSTSPMAMLSQTTSKASKMVEDELSAFVTGRSMGSGARMMPSGTGHAHLGVSGGSMDSEIAAAVRGF